MTGDHLPPMAQDLRKCCDVLQARVAELEAALCERELRKRIGELEASIRAAYEVWKTSPIRTRDGMLGQYMEDLNIVLREGQ